MTAIRRATHSISSCIISADAHERTSTEDTCSQRRLLFYDNLSPYLYGLHHSRRLNYILFFSNNAPCDNMRDSRRDEKARFILAPRVAENHDCGREKEDTKKKEGKNGIASNARRSSRVTQSGRGRARYRAAPWQKPLLLRRK